MSYPQDINKLSTKNIRIFLSTFDVDNFLRSCEHFCVNRGQLQKNVDNVDNFIVDNCG